MNKPYDLTKIKSKAILQTMKQIEQYLYEQEGVKKCLTER